MTTIAYRDGVLAADSMAYGGNYNASPGAKWKIWRLNDGCLLGVSSGQVGAGEAIRDYLNGEWPFGWGDLPATFQAIRIDTDGEVFHAVDRIYWSGPIEAPYHAIGSGADFALGAMAHGASAAEAIEAAKQHDQHTGNETRFLSL